MAELLKRWFSSRKKQRLLNYITKEWDEYIRLKARLKAQGMFLNNLIDGYNGIYGESLSKPQKEGEQVDR